MTARFMFTADQDLLLRRVYRGEISMVEACEVIGCGAETARRRVLELGLSLSVGRPSRATPKTITGLPKATDGWVAIAHKSDRHWKELSGAPLTIHEARTAEGAGVGTMAHRRVDGGWDLLFKAYV